jgi:hypothetical protein
LALRALHGREKYIAVFKTNPKPKDARAYCEAGLIWAKEATVARLLASIDVWAHGVLYPFYLRTTKYCVVVQPGPATSPEARLAVFESVVTTETATRHASATKAAADIAAGLLPF